MATIFLAEAQAKMILPTFQYRDDRLIQGIIPE